MLAASLAASSLVSVSSPVARPPAPVARPPAAHRRPPAAHRHGLVLLRYSDEANTFAKEAARAVPALRETASELALTVPNVQAGFLEVTDPVREELARVPKVLSSGDVLLPALSVPGSESVGDAIRSIPSAFRDTLPAVSAASVAVVEAASGDVLLAASVVAALAVVGATLPVVRRGSGGSNGYGGQRGRGGYGSYGGYPPQQGQQRQDGAAPQGQLGRYGGIYEPLPLPQRRLQPPPRQSGYGYGRYGGVYEQRPPPQRRQDYRPESGYPRQGDGRPQAYDERYGSGQYQQQSQYGYPAPQQGFGGQQGQQGAYNPMQTRDASPSVAGAGQPQGYGGQQQQYNAQPQAGYPPQGGGYGQQQQYEGVVVRAPPQQGQVGEAPAGAAQMGSQPQQIGGPPQGQEQRSYGPASR